MKATGVWKWKGMTAPDWFLVHVVAPEGWIVVGTDARNFTKVKVLGVSDERE